MKREKLLKFNNNLPFPLFYDYLKNLNHVSYIIYTCLTEEPNNFYKNCFSDVNTNLYEKFFDNYEKEKLPNYRKIADLKIIFKDNTFINLINNIMKSDVMKDAYNRLYIWYSTDGEFDINKDYLQ